MFDVIPMTLFSTLAVLALILLNAIWVAAEFAIVRVRRTRLEELAGQGVEAAKHAIVVVDGISDYLALTQIGITVASLAVGWLAEDAVVRASRFVLSGPRPTQRDSFMQSGLPPHSSSSPCCTSFWESRFPSFSPSGAPSNICWFSRAPYASFILFCDRSCGSSSVCRPGSCATWDMGCHINSPLTEEELKLILAESHKGGIVSDGEAQIIVRAFEFADKQSEEIMIPAEKVSYISLERTLEQNLDAARKHMHARLPVCRSGLDSVIGTVSMKDVWPLLDRERSNAAFERACRPPIILPLDFSQEEILKAFQKGRGQIGIVRNRAGDKTLGIVTLEDVLESLIGDVREAKPSGINYSTRL